MSSDSRRIPVTRRNFLRSTADPEWNALWLQLNKTPDPVKYKDIVHQMQAIEYERGGYIIAAFGNEIDAVKSNVHGFDGKHTTGVLQAFHFEPVWIG